MPAKMDEYCAKNGFAGWFETSAKDNVNIEESAKALVSKVIILTLIHFNENLIKLFLTFFRYLLTTN